MGISEPLIEVIDILFRMHSRGFIRPLVRCPAAGSQRTHRQHCPNNKLVVSLPVQPHRWRRACQMPKHSPGRDA